MIRRVCSRRLWLLFSASFLISISSYSVWSSKFFRNSKLSLLVTSTNDLSSIIETELISSSQNEVSDAEINSDQNPRVKVQILAYKRGGSSFIGEIFNRNYHVWYNFEPLAFFMSQVTTKRLRYRWDEMESGNYNKLDYQYKYYTSFLSDLLNCKISPELFKFYLAGVESAIRHGYFNPRLFVVKSFQLKWALVNGTNTRHKLEERCRQSNVTASKTIRLLHAEALKRHLPRDIWVLHLVRDPRAIAVSRKQKTKPSGALCRLIADNLHTSINMEDQGHRWITIRYEDLAYSPQENARVLYDKLGLGSVPSEVKQWIEENTQGERDRKTGEVKQNFSYKKKGLSLSTSRDSAAAAEHWIRDISPQLAYSYDSDPHCQYVYHTLGYKNYSELLEAQSAN